MAQAKGNVTYWVSECSLDGDTKITEFSTYGEASLYMAQCIPSREGLYSAFQIPQRYLEDAPSTPVEEDSVFAPREVEIDVIRT